MGTMRMLTLQIHGKGARNKARISDLHQGSLTGPYKTDLSCNQNLILLESTPKPTATCRACMGIGPTSHPPALADCSPFSHPQTNWGRPHSKPPRRKKKSPKPTGNPPSKCLRDLPSAPPAPRWRTRHPPARSTPRPEKKVAPFVSQPMVEARNLGKL